MNILVVIGGGIFVMLGVAHAIFTLQSTPTRGPLTPTSSEVQAAMQVPGGLGMAPDLEQTLWRAWIGFNLSHSIGVVGVGVVVLAPAIADFDGALGHWWWPTIAIALPIVYLGLSLRYWFRDPTVGISVGLALVAIGTIGGLIS